MTTSTRDRPGSLLRLWLELEPPWRAPNGMFGISSVALGNGNPPGGSSPAIYLFGCGVSGYDEDDCIELVRDSLFGERALPPIRRRVPGVDVSTLPQPVLRSLGVPVYRGVWFPALNRNPPT